MLPLLAIALSSLAACAQAPQAAPAPAAAPDPVKALVNQLELSRYKATIKGLTQFGDRRQGTDRNRAAVDWIEAQLKSYGCPTERVTYNYTAPPPRPRTGPPAGYDRSMGPGGSKRRGNIFPDTVNSDPMKQPDEKLRALNMQPSTDGERQEVFCTKVGTKHPDQVYILGAHMDGIGWGEAANDDGSGTALVMEMARVFGLSSQEFLQQSESHADAPEASLIVTVSSDRGLCGGIHTSISKATRHELQQAHRVPRTTLNHLQ